MTTDLLGYEVHGALRAAVAGQEGAAVETGFADGRAWVADERGGFTWSLEHPGFFVLVGRPNPACREVAKRAAGELGLSIRRRKRRTSQRESPSWPAGEGVNLAGKVSPGDCIR
jgi:hypothetical protein